MAVHPNNPDPRRRGSALLMVLILVAVTAVMCWAMLSETSIRADASAAASAAALASEHNADGMELAMHYLANPDESNEGTVNGINGPYWPGGVYSIDGTDVAITVTPEPGDVFLINASTTTNGITRSDQQRVQRETVFQPTHALQVRGNARLPHDWTITGGIKAVDNLTFTGTGPTYADPVVATNHTAYPDGSAPGPNAEDETSPQAHDVSLLNTNDYVYDGQTYSIEYHHDDVRDTTLGTSASNPLGVHRIGNNKTLDNVTVNGTIIGHDHIYIEGDVTINPADNMPALLTRKELRFEKDARFGVLGMVYVAEHLHGEDSAAVKIQGTLLIAAPRPDGLDDHWAGELEVIYDADAASVRDFSDVVTAQTTFKVLD
ncbi:MAG: hypothetical protein AAGD32_11635 [Planctomycetota bacterium]